MIYMWLSYLLHSQCRALRNLPIRFHVINSAFQSHGDMLFLQQEFVFVKYNFYTKFFSAPQMLEKVSYKQIAPLLRFT